MKPKERYFFYNDGYQDHCHTLDYFIDISLEQKATFPIVGAKIMFGEDFFYCAEFGEVGLKEDSECGFSCKKYEPRNGKSGICKHNKNCYEPNGNIYIINIGKVESQKHV